VPICAEVRKWRSAPIIPGAKIFVKRFFKFFLKKFFYIFLKKVLDFSLKSEYNILLEIEKFINFITTGGFYVRSS